MNKWKWALLLCLWVAGIHAQNAPVKPGDERYEIYLPLLKGKRVALFANHTAMIGEKHILDILVEKGVGVTAIFAPEHGFRGKADAGEHVRNSVDTKTGIPVLSLYDGNSGKPSSLSMRKFDVLLVDIQDVGLRFYTYYITMCRLMEACAETGKTVIVLDRPNPNGHYVDGPILDMKYKSGVGWLPIPVVHGMTLGELALMINGEKWLPRGLQCHVTVVPCENYTHATHYRLPIAPSPNLPNMKSIYLYPSTCLFEGTIVSLGRGTNLPFQVFGHPEMKTYPYSFTPRSVEGAKNPPLLNQKCYGRDLSALNDTTIWTNGFDLGFVIEAYHALKKGDKFFTPFFEKLVGVDYIRTMIKEGKTAAEIRVRWAEDVARFKEQRKPYLLYEDIEEKPYFKPGKRIVCPCL